MKGIRYKKGLLKRCFSLLLILAVVWSGVSAPVISFAESLSGTQEGAAVPEGQSEPQGQNGATGETVPQGESGTQGQNPEGIQATQSEVKNVTDLLLKGDNLKAIILQDGQELDNNAAIDPKKPLNVVLSFKVPVENDYSVGEGGPDPLQIVKQGDYAKFEIAEGLDLSEDSAWKNLYFTDTTDNKIIKVGEFQFSTKKVAGKNTVFLSVLFTANKDVNVQSETYDDINIFESYKGIEVNCSASFKLEDLDNPQTPGETEQAITILGKEYKFKIAPPTEVALKKTGRVIIDEPDNRAIEWTLDITGNPDGCELVDDLSKVGEYVDGSFKIQYSDKTVKANPTYENNILRYTFSKDTLQDLKSSVKVSFQTRLIPQEFRAGVEKPKPFYPENKLTKKENTAKLIKTEGGEQKEKAVATATVEWGPVWVTKKGEPVFDTDTKQHYIDWTITVNEKEKAVLRDVVITDVLRKGWHEITNTLYQQEFVEASLTIYDKDGEQVSATNYTKGSDGVIQDGSENKVEINDKAQDVHGRAAVAFTFPKIAELKGRAVLKLKSKVNRGDLELGKFMGRDNRFYNDVKVTWENNPDKLPAIATANVGIGQRALTKSVAPDGIFATAKVSGGHLKTYIKPVTTWNIKVQGAEITTDSAVYDMLIFDSTVKREDITGGKLTLVDGNTKVDGIAIKDFVPFEINGRIRYYQYMDGSFYSDNKVLEAQAIPLYKDDKHVGDLLRVNGFKDKDKDNTSFTFKTRLRDPWLLVNPEEDVFIDKGASHTATNTVYIAKESRIFDTHTDYPRYISRMLEKETLTAAQGAAFIKENKSEFVNSNIISETDLDGSSFNHARRSILYRLSVNADKIQDMGALTVKDELPTGWELKNYWIFRGESELLSSLPLSIEANTEAEVEKNLKENSHARVKATGAVILTGKETNETSEEVKVSVKEGEPLSFNFPDIKEAYVILIEAGPTAETLSEYMKDSGNSHKVLNKASLYFESSNTQRIEKTQTTLVNLKQEIISKAYIYDPKKPGELKWYIDYIADGKSKEDDKLIIEDTLKKGIAVRFDSEGKLLYGEYKIVELGFDAEGKPTETAFDLDLKDYISYKKVRETGESEKEVLTFKVPNPIKSYRFYYITDITGNKGEEVENTVVLKKNTDKIAEHAPKKKYKILEIDASAKATRIATLEIIKVDSEDKKALEGAEFTLKKEDGTLVAKVTTDKNGRAEIKKLDPGNYILVETQAPKDYKLNKTEYKVTVTNNGSANVVKVDGKTGPLQVENTKDPTTPPTPPEKPEKPPVTPPGTPDTPPVTPPGNPFIPPADTVPDDPVPLPPTYPFDEIPDPNDPGSPDTIMVVDEDDTPLGIYEKKENPDGTFDYVVVDDKVPLDHIPKTGDRSYPIYFGFLFLLTIPVFMKKRKEL